MGVRTKLVTGVAGVALGAVAAFAQPAAAAPFTAGTGHDPQVATAPDGTGHVVWIADAPGGDSVGYCRVPRGGDACARTESLAFPGAGDIQATHSVPQAFALADGRVVLVASCWNCGAGGTTDRTFAWTSTDGGGSFGPPAERGNGLILAGQGDLIPETGTIVGIGIADLLAMGDAPLTTPPIKHTASSIVESPAVARVPGADQLVAVSGDMDQIRFARYAGPLTATAIDTQASWTIDQPVAGAATDSTDASLAAGPRGLLLSYVAGDRPDRVRLHAYDAASGAFDGGRIVARSVEIQEPDLSQATDGELAFVWRSTTRDGQLRWRRASADGTFSPVARLVGGEHAVEPEVSAAPGEGGFVVWKGPSSSVRVLALPEPPPAVYDGPARAARRADRRLRYRLIVPRRCVHAGQRFDATLRWRPRRGEDARVRRVTFSVGREPRVADGSSPFRQTLTLSEFAELGSRVTVRAKPEVRSGDEDVRGRTVRTRITVCG